MTRLARLSGAKIISALRRAGFLNFASAGVMQFSNIRTVEQQLCRFTEAKLSVPACYEKFCGMLN